MPNTAPPSNPRKDPTVYYVTTKTQPGVKVRVISTANKRDVARGEASRLGGTCRTQAEIDELIHADKLDRTSLPGYVAPEPVATPAPAPAPTPAPDTGDQPPCTGRWNELAANVATAHRKAATVGKKDRTPKRVETPATVLEQAEAYLRGEGFGGASKVHIVRNLANWKSTDGLQLQRRDALVLLAKTHPGIATATVSTQWQVARGMPKTPVQGDAPGKPAAV